MLFKFYCAFDMQFLKMKTSVALADDSTSSSSSDDDDDANSEVEDVKAKEHNSGEEVKEANLQFCNLNLFPRIQLAFSNIVGSFLF